MSHLNIWEETLRGLPHDGGAAAVWIVRREGDEKTAPLRMLCGWTAHGGPAPLPLGLVLRVLQSREPTEQREESRSRRPPLCQALPLADDAGAAGVLVAAGSATDTRTISVENRARSPAGNGRAGYSA